MRYIRLITVSAGFALLLGGTASCGEGSSAVNSGSGLSNQQVSTEGSMEGQVPRFESMGSRAIAFDTVGSLAAKSSNIVIADATGDTRKVPLPDSAQNPNVDSPPNIFVTVHVTTVLSGKDIEPGDDVEVVSFGPNVNTGHESLVDAGRYLLFLAPYLFGPNDAGGGYIVVGGPAGMFYAASSDSGNSFAKVDTEGQLPAEIDSSTLDVTAGYTDEEYLATGGR